MQNFKWYIRIGLLLIGVSGFIFAIGDALIPQEGDMFSASENPQAFAELVTLENFKIWAMRGFIGVILEFIGTVALFLSFLNSPQVKTAFWAFLLTAIGDLFGIVLFSITFHVFPFVGEMINAETMGAVKLASTEGFIGFIMMGTMIFTVIGLLIFAIAIWKSSHLPKWSGIIVLVGFLMIAIQNYYVQFLANIVWGVAYLWMAGYIWNKFED